MKGKTQSYYIKRRCQLQNITISNDIKKKTKEILDRDAKENIIDNMYTIDNPKIGKQRFSKDEFLKMKEVQM